MKNIYKDYRTANAQERAAMELKYGKVFNRLIDEMASLDIIRQTARQCPNCSIYVDVSIFFFYFFHSSSNFVFLVEN